jgi:hypothetical protein
VRSAGDAAETAARAAEADVAERADAAADAVDELARSQEEALHGVEVAGQTVVEGVTRFQREIIDFVSERIRQDMETQQAMLRCRTFDEVRDVQTRFFQTAMDQYSTETNRLMKLGTEMMQRSLERGD